MFARRSIAPIAVPLVLLAALAQAAQGQASSPRSGPSGSRVERGRGVFKELHLTKAQRGQVRAIGDATNAARRAIFAHYRQGQVLAPADRDQLRALGEGHNAAIREILTPDQRTRLEAHLAALRAALKQPRGPRPSGTSAPTNVEPRRTP